MCFKKLSSTEIISGMQKAGWANTVITLNMRPSRLLLGMRFDSAGYSCCEKRGVRCISGLVSLFPGLESMKISKFEVQ